jgi:D-sedoheptulose 7-phosphate isomerase
MTVPTPNQSPTAAPSTIRSSLRDARVALDALLAHEQAMESLHAAGALLADVLKGGRKVLICGTGGSMCDAAHFAEELTGRFRQDRAPLAAIACNDPGHLSCTANDYGFEHVFSRWVQALGRSGDCLILLSTSGNSPNCVRAADAARLMHMPTIALLGKDGGALRPLVNHAILVPGATSDRIQELHMLILHAWVESIEVALFGRS